MTLQVFISYKSQERSFAEQLRDQLRAWGFSTWLDKDNIPEGAYFRHEIQKGLETSHVVIGLLTEEALQSREVMWEWDYALYNSRLIPVMLRPCKLPYHLQGTQYLDFTQPNTTAFDRLRQAITSPVGAQYIAPNPVSITKPQITTSTSATNRTRMLDKVHEFWVVGVLENALKESGTFELGLSVAPGAVLKHIDYGDYQLPSTTGIGEVFNDLNRELLILGAPGAGKTILLLQLARHLIERAHADETQPIPVVFNLSSWAAERKPLEDWLVSELRLKYQVPQKAAKEWVEHEKLLLLLDGLDEVAEEFRNQCVDTINTFRRTFKAVDIAVCSRIADYEPLTSKLDLRGAIVLQPLSPDQIATYLNRPELEGLRTVLKTDTALQTMAGSPFLLNTIVYTYQGMSPISLQISTTDNPKQRRRHLFDTYIEKRLSSPHAGSLLAITNKPYRTRSYLTWLASKMINFKQSVFYIESLQPKQITTLEYQQYKILLAIFLGILWGVLAGILFSLFLGISIGAIAGLIGFIFGFLLVPAQRIQLFALEILIGNFSKIKTVDRLNWNIVWINVAIYSGLGAFLGILLSIVDWKLGTSVWIASTLFGIIFEYSVRVSPNQNIETHTVPNEGIILSVRNAFQGGIPVGIMTGIALSLILAMLNWNIRIGFGLGAGLFVGVSAALYFGGLAAIQHLILRLLLYRAGHIPWNYARFLDYCASIGLLRKVGGGYIFAHRYLLEYFAELDA